MIRGPWSGVLAFCAAGALSGCVSIKMYVDPALAPADKQSVTAVAKPEPIQVLYEFRTKGVANATATQRTSTHVTDVLRNSGLFSEVSTSPVLNLRRLLITIDNVPITTEGEAMAKGFGVGLTFGLVGTMVTEGYICEATLSTPNAQPMSLNYRHALYATIGNASGPPGLAGHPPADAIKLLVDQLTWSVLRDVSKSGRL
jgi:hypothetical protein